MPFCTQCGNQVRDTDAYCGRCGGRQAARPGPLAGFPDLSPKAAYVLCYVPILGWIACIVVLMMQKFRYDRLARFHAFQGLYLFVAWLIADWVLTPLLPFPAVAGDQVRHLFHFGAFAGLLKAFLLGVWIYMLVKTSQGDVVRLPILGELAEKSAETA